MIQQKQEINFGNRKNLRIWGFIFILSVSFFVHEQGDNGLLKYYAYATSPSQDAVPKERLKNGKVEAKNSPSNDTVSTETLNPSPETLGNENGVLLVEDNIPSNDTISKETLNPSPEPSSSELVNSTLEEDNVPSNDTVSNETLNPSPEPSSSELVNSTLEEDNIPSNDTVSKQTLSPSPELSSSLVNSTLEEDNLPSNDTAVTKETLSPSPEASSSLVNSTLEEDNLPSNDTAVSKETLHPSHETLGNSTGILEEDNLPSNDTISEKPSILSSLDHLVNSTTNTSMFLPSIPTNPNSTVDTDIVRIWHDPYSGSVCIHLKEDARCPHPALLGRLSGPALAILDWKELEIDGAVAGTMLCGSYSNKWLDAGEYFLEIIVLYCEDFGVGTIGRIHDNNITAWFNTTLRCNVEDPMNNRITSKTNSTILITSPTSGTGNYRIGRWVRRKGLPLRPLFTRSQPKPCFGKRLSAELQEQCSAFTGRDIPSKGLWRDYQGEDIRGLPEYEFQWGLNITTTGDGAELIDRLRQRMHENSTFPKMCAVGDSHSKRMVRDTLPVANLTGMFRYIGSNWPQPGQIEAKLSGSGCEKLFVQIGQWPASIHTGGNPFKFGKYHDQVKEHVQNILKTIENNTDGMIYLPTLDHSPLNGRITRCTDWRTPPTMDGYSFVNQLIEHELKNTSKVKYIDTSFIIYTHWDGPQDWQHLAEDVRYEKTLFMAALLLGELDGLDLD
ncbi:unnamed protein product [Cylindrotheca closterium]|uniref:Uncharacterized protein n=1 Tax=Cylindrotheca closterium TaxID=2856 RepID=A0AAD2G4L6_9STRA|nr:unnamed protein product [Cylindrotheca closterium]